MAFYAADVMRKASIILNDAGAVRWPLTELWDPIRYALNARPFLTCH